MVIETQEAFLTFALNKETVVRAGRRGDTEGARAECAGRENGRGIHGQAICDVRLLTLLRENRFELVPHLLLARFIGERCHLSNRGAA